MSPSGGSTARGILGPRTTPGAKPAIPSVFTAANAPVAAAPVARPAITASTPAAAPPSTFAGRARAGRRGRKPVKQLTPEEQDWKSLVPGIYQAAFFVLMLGALRWFDIGEDERPTQIVCLLLGICAIRSAFLYPRRLPMLLAGFVPYSACYAGKIPGVPAGNLTNLLLGSMLIAYVAAKRTRPKSRPFGPIEYLLSTFLGLAFLSHAAAQMTLGDMKTMEFFIEYRQFAGGFLIYFMFRAVIANQRDIKAVFFVILFTVSTIGFVSIKEGEDHSRGSIEKSRISGILQQPNTLGAYFAYYGAPLCALFSRGKGWKVRSAALLGLAFATKGLTYTFSRGAYLALGGGCFLVMLVRNPLTLVLYSGAYVAVASVYPAVIPASVLNRLGQTQGQGSEMDDGEERLDGSSMERIMLWRAAFKMIPDYPVLGVGLNRFGRYIVFYHEKDLIAQIERGGYVATDAHNAYIKVAGEFGIPALIVLVAMLCTILFTALTSYFTCRDPDDRTVCLALFGATIAVLAACMFGSRFADENLTGDFWILVACVQFLRAQAIDKRAQQRAQRRTRVSGPDYAAVAAASAVKAVATSAAPRPRPTATPTRPLPSATSRAAPPRPWR